MYLYRTSWGLKLIDYVGTKYKKTLSFLSYVLAKEQKESILKAILEHLGIAIVVIISTYYVGVFVSNVFGGGQVYISNI